MGFELGYYSGNKDIIQGYAKDFHKMLEIFLWNSLAFIPFVEVFSWAVKNALTKALAIISWNSLAKVEVSSAKTL